VCDHCGRQLGGNGRRLEDLKLVEYPFFEVHAIIFQQLTPPIPTHCGILKLFHVHAINVIRLEIGAVLFAH
jgi:hypothetical protein